MKKLILLVIGLLLLLNLKAKTTFENFIPSYKGKWFQPPICTPNNKVPDGAICGNGDVGLVLGGTPEDQTLYISKNDFWKTQNGYPNGGVCYLGQLSIKSKQLKGAQYYVEQRLSDALICGLFKQKNGTGLKTKIWCSATQNIAVVELENLSSSLDLSIDFQLPKGMGAKTQSGFQNNAYWYTRQFNDSALEWTSEVAIAMSISNGNLKDCRLRPMQKLVVKLAFCTNHEQSLYKYQSEKMLNGLNESSLNKLYRSHCNWWKMFWNKSQVNLNDDFLEKYYYSSLYLLACCSRNNAFPPGLWGTSLTMDATANGWAGDYHTNYNYMAPWWGTYASNHVELSEPYDAPILEYMEKGKQHSKMFLNKKGVYYPVGIGPKGFCSSMFPLTEDAMMKLYGTPEYKLEGGYMFLGQKSNAAFCTTNMFMRFYHTYDKSYAQKVYPFIRAVADFWEDYLVFENGRYVSYDDNFWEVGPWEGKDFKAGYGDINPTISLGLCRMLFKGILDMSEFLQIDAEKSVKWKHILMHLSDIPTVKVDNVIRIKACEGGNGSGSRTAPGFGRVMMHGLLFPSGVCGVVTDSAFAKILRDEIYRWDTDTLKYNGPQDARWNNLSNGIETYFTSAARVGYDGNRLLGELKKRIKRTAFNNLWIPQEGGGVESLSAVPSCINEMLLQSYEGIIRVFPVWPKEKKAAFKNLRTYGAFLISSSCNNGKVNEVSIFSEKGRFCQIENPWVNHSCIVLRENGKREVYNLSSFGFSTKINERIQLICGK